MFVSIFDEDELLPLAVDLRQPISSTAAPPGPFINFLDSVSLFDFRSVMEHAILLKVLVGLDKHGFCDFLNINV